MRKDTLTLTIPFLVCAGSASFLKTLRIWLELVATTEQASLTTITIHIYIGWLTHWHLNPPTHTHTAYSYRRSSANGLGITSQANNGWDQKSDERTARSIPLDVQWQTGYFLRLCCWRSQRRCESWKHRGCDDGIRKIYGRHRIQREWSWCWSQEKQGWVDRVSEISGCKTNISNDRLT